MEEKRIIVLTPLVLLATTSIIIIVGIIFGNKANAVTYPNCPTCGKQMKNVVSISLTQHKYICISCTSDAPKGNYVLESHKGGEKKHPNGNCIVCNKQYAKHDIGEAHNIEKLKNNSVYNHVCYYKCRCSGCTYSSYMEGHYDVATKVKKAATCNENGIEVIYCPKSGLTIDERQTPTIEHSWDEDGICKNCSAIDQTKENRKTCPSCGERRLQVKSLSYPNSISEQYHEIWCSNNKCKYNRFENGLPAWVEEEHEFKYKEIDNGVYGLSCDLCGYNK